MRKMMMLLFALLFVVACASENGTTSESEQANGDNQDIEVSGVTREILYSYHHEDASEYYLMALQTDADARGVIFIGVEEIDRVTDYYTYFINHNDEVIEATSLADDPNQDRRCADMSFSPNGKYMIYNCHDDGIDYSIYDLEEEEIIYQVASSDLYVQSVVGVSDDLTVYLESVNDDGENQLTLYHVEDETSVHFVLDDILNVEHLSVNTIMPTDDGTKIFFDAVVALFILDVESGEVDEVANLEPLWDSLGDDDIFIYNARMSPDGKYLYYHISDNSNDVDYDDHVFHDLETNEVESYAEFEYESVRNFDGRGNLLLADEDQLYLYNFESKETRVVPEVSLSRHSRYMTLASNGAFLIYSDKERNDDDSYTQHLYRVSLGDIDAYETTDLKVSGVVATDAGDADEVNETNEQDGIALHDASLNETELLIELWEDSTDVMFPTDFPGDVESVNYLFSGDASDRRFVQNMYLGTSHRDEITLTASFVEDEDDCLALRELDVVKNVDGIDYYFYDYQNDDVEAGVVIDGVCYFLEAEDYTEDEMLGILESLASIESVAYELPVDGFKFPTSLPIASPEARYPNLSVFDDGNTFNYTISYLGDGEHDLRTTVQRQKNKPNLYQNENNGFAVDVDGWDEAFFQENRMVLQLFDGDYYYTVELSDADELVDELGVDEVVEIYTGIGESFQ